MLKSEPGHRPATQPPTLKHPAANRMTPMLDQAVAATIAAPLPTGKAGGETDQRESSVRQAHRLRMKEFFSRVRSIS